MNDLPVGIRHFFLEAGWLPGAQPRFTSELGADDHPAWSVLAEFNGLKVGQTGAGEECATSDVVFQELSGQDSTIDLWSRLLDSHLVRVAEFHHSHGELLIDQTGRCFAWSLIDDNFCFAGATFAEAMESLLLGRRLRPMLRPDQQEMSVYGESIRTGDPRIFVY